MALALDTGDRGADISACGKYRYTLWRRWDPSKPTVLFVMLNPSTADADVDDPTIRKCMGFAKRWGYGGLAVCNLYPWRRVERFIRTAYAHVLEMHLHHHFAEHRSHGEWFSAEPVLTGTATLSDGELLRAAGVALDVTGRARDIARWLGTDHGRDAAERLPLRMVAEHLAVRRAA